MFTNYQWVRVARSPWHRNSSWKCRPANPRVLSTHAYVHARDPACSQEWETGYERLVRATRSPTNSLSMNGRSSWSRKPVAVLTSRSRGNVYNSSLNWIIIENTQGTLHLQFTWSLRAKLESLLGNSIGSSLGCNEWTNDLLPALYYTRAPHFKLH